MSRIAKLPAGYRQVEYIQSSGEQYVDTGFKPRYNSRVVADISDLANVSGFVFGTRNSASAGQFTAYRANETTFRSDYFATQQSTTLADSTARTTIDKNGNVLTAYGLTITNTAVSSGGCNYPLFLFALNNTGSPLVFASYKLYSCQIYDNGTLIRDYVPCINPSSEAGLYDLVYGIFYGNAGTGVFAVGRNVYSEDEIIKLEYVESTGEQYVNTEFKPNQDTRITLDAQYTVGAKAEFMFGVRTSTYKDNYSVTITTGGIRSDYGESLVADASLALTERYAIDKNKNICAFGGTKIANAASTFQSTLNLFLFACNEGGTGKFFGKVRMYSCQLYDNGTLIREYHPATADGEVGLWDACSGVLYTSGSGTALIAGPEMETAPSTPSNLEILEYTDTSVLLGWSEVANAFGYRVYKNGGLYAEQTDTEFSDEVAPYQSVEYGVSAYNDKGESKTALLTVYISPDNPIPYLITDRAQTDADRVAALALMDYESMTDSERAEWNSDLKGAYNASDLNRVESAVAYLAEALRVLPIELREYAENFDVGWDKYFDVPYGSDAYSVTTKENWTIKDVPTPADMERYLANVVKLRNALKFASDALPQTMNDLRWQGANAIESALKNLDAAIVLFKENTQIMIVNTAGAWAYSGEVFMGEV